MTERSEPEALDLDALDPQLRSVLVRGIGAFLKATPPQELPGSVRRLSSFTPPALARHAPKVLALLDDKGMRARILEWLDEGKPAVPKKVATTLRAAAEGAEAFERVVAGRALESTPKKDREADRIAELERAVEREVSKAKKAREEARRIRSQSAEELRAAQREARTAAGRSDKLQVSLDKALARVAEAEAASGRELAASERELRRARRDLEKAISERDGLRGEVKELKKKVTRLERERRAPEKPVARPKPQRRTPTPEEPKGPRSPLPVPRGRLEDAPETLAEWLQVHGVHLVVDGYNVTKAEGGFGDVALERQRDLLISEVTKLVRRKKASATIVFDGKEVPARTSRLPRGPVKVEYSRGDEIADDHIIALLETLPPYPAILATNDRELQDRARELGATIATSNQLLGLIR